MKKEMRRNEQCVPPLRSRPSPKNTPATSVGNNHCDTVGNGAAGAAAAAGADEVNGVVSLLPDGVRCRRSTDILYKETTHSTIRIILHYLTSSLFAEECSMIASHHGCGIVI
jgi:hypothetical protein